GTLDRLRNFYGQKSFKEEFCVEDEIRNTLAFFGDYVENSNITIEFHTDKEHMVKNYKNELSQTLLSILQNSKEAIETKKGGQGQITIKVYEKNKTIAVSVVDNGGGMDEKTLHQIFDPYFSTKFKTNDVGLGLYLAKVSVEKNMGGRLVAKKIKDGLEMVIELPSPLNDAI
ncbi:MAG TPA: HAMP domain-containing sensor histidine kinase, partial [Campylobacterales bacterium]|nr:HAMP domain-containing sensor histidine kinase [Campylobacterales bacterium]